jgi:hypothetical protein
MRDSPGHEPRDSDTFDAPRSWLDRLSVCRGPVPVMEPCTRSMRALTGYMFCHSHVKPGKKLKNEISLAI